MNLIYILYIKCLYFDSPNLVQSSKFHYIEFPPRCLSQTKHIHSTQVDGIWEPSTFAMHEDVTNLCFSFFSALKGSIWNKRTLFQHPLPLEYLLSGHKTIIKIHPAKTVRNACRITRSIYRIRQRNILEDYIRPLILRLQDAIHFGRTTLVLIPVFPIWTGFLLIS